jgi:hypothetical protein
MDRRFLLYPVTEGGTRAVQRTARVIYASASCGHSSSEAPATNLNTAFLDGVHAESFTEAEDKH